MRRPIIAWVLVCAVAIAVLSPRGRAAAAGRDPKNAAAERVLARVHFKGFDQLAAGTNAATLQQIWKMAQTGALRSVALDKLAPAVLKTVLGGGSDPASIALIRPLLEDLARGESILELVERPGHAPAWTLAIRLEEQRRNVWRDNWGKLFQGAKTQPGVFAVAPGANSWIVVGHDSGAVAEGKINTPLWREAGALSKTPSGTHWLKADADWPHLTNSIPSLAWLALPRLNVAIEAKGDGLRTEARLTYAKPQNWALETWRLPTNSIRDPLVSFTAARGIGSWLGRQPWFREMGLDAVPNQLVAWGQSDTPFQIQFAFPVANATNSMKLLARHWVPIINSNLVTSPLEAVQVHTNLQQISGRFMFLAPFIRRAPEPAGEFLNGGVFPLARLSPKLPPPELFSQINRRNLLYYDWEITQYRLEQLRETTEVLATLLTLPQLPTTTAGRRWLDAAGPKLGNTITEITQDSPTELTLVRRSHAGFNGLELLALAGWIESANFPKIDLGVGFRPTPTSRRGKTGAVPLP
jgi:hypothetical protein